MQEGVRKHCPGMIVQFSTGGRGRDPAARGNALNLRPDMASLSTGSVNFPTIVYENSASLVVDLATKMQANGVRPEIELFDLSHIHGARRLINAGLMDKRPHVQVVMGVKNALPADKHLLDLMLGEIRRQLPHASWTAAGIGANQARVMGLGAGARRRRGADGLGGHADRVGPLGKHCLGLMLPVPRKSVERLAAALAPSRVAAKGSSTTPAFPSRGATRSAWLISIAASSAGEPTVRWRLRCPSPSPERACW